MGWRRFFRRGWWDAERAKELQAYLDIETDENIARGMPPDEARAAAQRKLGNPVRIREEIYAMNTIGVIDRLWQDLRYGARVFGRSPGFTAAAVVTLALGIGGVTIIYSVIRNILLDPFPYADSRRMVDLLIRDTAKPDWLRGAMTADEFLDYQEQSEVFDGIIATISSTPMMMPAPEGVIALGVSQVSPNTFDFLGVEALIGRGIQESDGAPGASPVAVLSHEAWLTEFGGNAGVIGRAITINDTARTIVGVMPPRFTWHVADVWIPRVLRRGDADAETRQFWFQARLKPGISVEEASAHMDVIAARRKAQHPDDYPPQFKMSVITVIDWVVGRFRTVLYTLFGAVGLLLLIACCNVANMLLARATAREREFVLRAALGAGRGRLMAQLMMESLLLALAGAALGCLLAYGGVQVLAAFLPRQGVAYEVVLRLDRWALLFSVATAVATAFVFGLVPAWHSARRDVAQGMKSSGKGNDGGPSLGWVRNGLVIGEVGLSLVLLIGAGSLMREFLTMVRTDFGFSPGGLLAAGVRLPQPAFEATETREQYYQAAAARLAAEPGIVGASYTSNHPLRGVATGIERPGAEHTGRRDGRLILCGADYLAVVGVPMVRGRLLAPADIASARHVAVVNESLATRFFGDGDPRGQPIRLARLAELPQDAIDPVFEIVGVVRDVRNRGLNPTEPAAFVPSSVTSGFGSRILMVRAAGDAALAVEPLRRALRGVDRRVPVTEIQTMDYMMRQRFAQPRFSLIIFAVFATVGLLLVAVGVYGVMAYVVSQRTREIAIRMALGADQPAMIRAVLRTGALLLAVGVVIGLAVGASTTRLLPTTTPEPHAFDPVIGMTAVAVIAVMGLAACLVPALRASRVDPMTALRHE
jgi:putative ABC transport system permease protein